ncbi:MAG: hypothetical protein ABJJ37_05750 [Roseibium sp.]
MNADSEKRQNDWLSSRIVSYWAERGFEVSVVVGGQCTVKRYSVNTLRSDMINGLPVT